MDDSIYEVTRAEYASFVETIKQEIRRIESDETHADIINRATGKVICRRAMGQDEKEHYYIFELLSAEESLPPKAKLQLELKTREEVQAFFNALSKMQKEHNKK